MNLQNTIEVKSGLYKVESVSIDGKIIDVIRPNPNLTEEEFFSKDPYNEMLEKATEEQEFQKSVMIQRFVNDYLKSNGLETITERRTKNNKKDILGILTGDYKNELQKIVFEYARNNNIDLFANQERKNPIIGIMSPNEKKIADYLIEIYANFHNEEQKESGFTR